ncbi:MAG: hypothetical protein AMXMBFR7_17450 [Planctomycetota bacterium]
MLLTLTRHRWNLPLVAHLGASGEDSFNDLAETMRISRDSLSRSLDALKDSGLILRSESGRVVYALTTKGRRMAPPCTEVLDLARTREIEELALRRWTLPIAIVLENWSLRFNELKAALPEITPRALALALKDMDAAGLVSREIVGGFPPAASYKLTEAGVLFLPALARLN